VVWLGLSSELRRSLACTNIIENMSESQCEALALGVHGLAVDGCGDAGSKERPSLAEGSQTALEAPGGA